MRKLLGDAEKARELGRAARRSALERFNIHRFAAEWNAVLLEATELKHERFVA
jgi:hypothetical protein